MERNEMTPEKSLQIISDAIDRSRHDFEKNAGRPMILWGIIVLVFSVAVWYLHKNTGNAAWNFLWFGVPAAGWPLSAILFKGNGGKGTFISRTIGNIWIAYGIFATVLSATFAFLDPTMIGYLTAVLLGFAAAMTGLILKDNATAAGGFITGLGCTILLFIIQKCDATLLFGAAAVINLIVPGILMNRKSR